MPLELKTICHYYIETVGNFFLKCEKLLLFNVFYCQLNDLLVGFVVQTSLDVTRSCKLCIFENILIFKVLVPGCHSKEGFQVALSNV
ncbi:hypothetical protein FQN60_010074 [Etheostoma spectabile]|uniref:Uncharacterized protein n=1 Tax=Etheostoma spectabile TaxID=54343 RepID=A0A5J5D5N2_9PERO|nr:hypothetical protein FQN60_010074 [Etheostoma spectabile]